MKKLTVILILASILLAPTVAFAGGPEVITPDTPGYINDGKGTGSHSPSTEIKPVEGPRWPCPVPAVLPNMVGAKVTDNNMLELDPGSIVSRLNGSESQGYRSKVWADKSLKKGAARFNQAVSREQANSWLVSGKEDSLYVIIEITRDKTTRYFALFDLPKG